MNIGMNKVFVAFIVFLLALSSPAFAGEGEFTATVPGTDVIFLSGRTDVVIPNLGATNATFPLLRHGYVLSDFLKETFPKSLAAKPGMVFKFGADGWVHYYNGPGYGSGFGPDGQASGTSTLSAIRGISGYQGPQGPLAGVFLDDANPASGVAPATLNFLAGGTGTAFQTLSPQLGQVFFIGNGYTPDGMRQTFIAPEGATRLFLGIPDGFGFVGGPGAYEDNDGSFSVLGSYALPNCSEFASGIIDRACFYDDFNDNSVSATYWSQSQGGVGPVLAETNRTAEIYFPSGSYETGNGSFSTGLVSTCRLRGDFDIQADFNLLTWPAANGVRVALSAAAGPTERVSFGTYQDFPGQPREVYLTHFSDGVLGITATTDLSGKFRMVRTGNTVTSYHYSDGAWVAIHTGPATTGDAAFSLSAWSHDGVFGNQDVKFSFDNMIVNSGTLLCNNRPPVAKASARTAECTSANGASVTLDGSGSYDPDGDSLSYSWSWPGGSATGVAPTALFSFGTTTVTLTVDDRKGLTASDAAAVTVQDTTAPTTLASVSGIGGQNGWYVSEVTVSLNATDTCTGVREIHYTINGAETVVNGGTATFTLTADGTYVVTYWAVDNNGMEGSRGNTAVNRDAAPPVTVPGVPAPPADGNGNYRSCVPVTLTATAGASGVSEILYSLDGGGTWLPYTGEFTVCQEGPATITYKAVSTSGNVEQPKILVINIDKTAPLITASISPLPNNNGWHNTDVTVTFTCSDALSGVASCPAPVIVTTEGAGQVVSGTVVDKAGNTASTSVTLDIDKTAPLITAAISPSANNNGWHNTDVTVTFTCSDALSGVASCPAPVTVTAEGEGQIVSGTVVDKAGNTASTSVTLDIDKTAPLITAAISPSANGNGWHNTDVTVTFTCSDTLSGIASCPAPVTVTAEGAGQVVTGIAIDKAGNTASTSATVNIDKTAPAANISVTPAILWPPNHKMVNVAVNGGAVDNTSGVASVVITVTDEYGRVQPAVTGFNTTIQLQAWRKGEDRDGRHYLISAVITDKAGNNTTVTTEAVCPHDMGDKQYHDDREDGGEQEDRDDRSGEHEDSHD